MEHGNSESITRYNFAILTFATKNNTQSYLISGNGFDLFPAAAFKIIGFVAP